MLLWQLTYPIGLRKTENTELSGVDGVGRVVLMWSQTPVIELGA